MRDTRIPEFQPTLPCVNLPLVHEYVDGILDAATQRRVATHLADCAVCESERAFVAELRSHAASLPRLAPPDHLWDTIAASLGAISDRVDDEDLDALPALQTGTFAGDALPAGLTPARRSVRPWHGWVAGIGLSAAAATLLIPSALHQPGRSGFASSTAPGSDVTLAQTGARKASAVQPAAALSAPSAQARRSDGLVGRGDPDRASGAIAGAGDATGRDPGRVAAQVAAFPSSASIENPLIETSVSGYDALALTGVPLDGPNLARQVGAAELAVEQEKLRQAEAAIVSCQAALRDNPNDPRINMEFKRALDMKRHALQVIMAARRTRSPQAGSLEVYPVNLEPAGSARDFRW